MSRPAEAQNDWQFPDPYFGILEIEKSHDSTAWRRYRSDVGGAARREPVGTPDRPNAGLLPSDQPAAARPNRLRWRNRTRR